MNTGEPELERLRDGAAAEPIETVGAELRSLMHRAPGNGVGDRMNPVPETIPADRA
jgi:hypothetical protein